MKKTYFMGIGVMLLGCLAAIAERPVNGTLMDDGSTWCCETVSSFDDEPGQSSAQVSRGGYEYVVDTVWTVDTIRTTTPARSVKTGSKTRSTTERK